MKNKFISLAVCFALVLGTFVFVSPVEYADAAAKKPAKRASIVRTNKELRGVWLAFYDYKDVGLYNKSKTTFTKNADKVMKKIKEAKCNAVFLHVRAFDDAIWKSKTFKASKDIKPSSKKAYYAFSTYDPLKILCEKAKKYGLEVHAWMNPYRVTYSKFLNPAKKVNRNRVIKAINELSAYDIKGIHFDDYFYHSAGGYADSVSKKAKRIRHSAAQKRKYVNKLVKASYNACHAKGMIFGISPAGNYENDMSSGADVKTWYGKKGYVDYVCPQIYWTDNWGKKGKIKMFTQRLNQFYKLNKYPGTIKTYIGLALYRTGKYASDDKGWNKRSTNLKNQLKKIRGSKYKKKGVRGYILFDTGSLYKKRCQKELNNLKKLL